eukprot:UN01714
MDPRAISRAFGSEVINPDNTPYIYLTGPWIYLVMIFIVGVIIINCTMCLCISCQRTQMPTIKGKQLYDDDERCEINIYGQ